MFGYAIKKWFFDFWDNMVIIIVCNIAFDVGLAAVFLGPGVLAPVHPLLGYVALAIGIILTYLIAAGCNGLTFKLTKHEQPRFEIIKDSFLRCWKPSLAMGTINIAVFVITRIAIDYYNALGNIPAFLLAGIIFWALIFWLLMGSWYFPINAQLDTKIKKLFKKSMLLTLDNPGTTLAMGIMSLILLLISIFTFSLFPGIAGIMLWQNTILKLRLYKYDYKEANPEAKNKDIPWEVLLKDEMDKIGHRTLRSLIFPWKD